MAVISRDVVIVGAGPAGCSAALWVHKFGLSYALLDKGERIGGQIARINMPIDDVLGLRAENGRELRELLERDIRQKGIAPTLGTVVESIDLDSRTLETDRGDYRAGALVLALGLRRRHTGVEGEREYFGNGVYDSATSHMDALSGKRVAILGGGDGALENALLLEEHCPEIVVIHRREEFRAREEFLEKARESKTIRFITSATLSRVCGDKGRVTAIEVEGSEGRSKLETDALVLKIGYEPNLGALPEGSLLLDDRGYIAVDRYMRSSREGVFAVGDCCNPRSPGIAAAVGDGAIAAREAFEFLRK